MSSEVIQVLPPTPKNPEIIDRGDHDETYMGYRERMTQDRWIAEAEAQAGNAHLQNLIQQQPQRSAALQVTQDVGGTVKKQLSKGALASAQTAGETARAVLRGALWRPVQGALSLMESYSEPFERLELRAAGYPEPEIEKSIQERRRILREASPPGLSPVQGTIPRVVEDMTAFVAAFHPALKLLGGLEGAGAVAAAAKVGAAGGIADALVMNPHESALDAFVEQNPELRGPVEKFLVGDDTESEFAGRVRNFLTGVPIGIATEAFGRLFVKTARGLRTRWADWRKAAGEDVSQVMARVSEEEAMPVASTELSVAGKPPVEGAPDVEIRRTPYAKGVRPVGEVPEGALPDRAALGPAPAPEDFASTEAGREAARNEGARGLDYDEARAYHDAYNKWMNEGKIPQALQGRAAQVERALAEAGVEPGNLRERAAIARESLDQGLRERLAVNWNTVSAPEDVKSLWNDLSALLAPRIQASRRGVVTEEATRWLAAQANLTPAEFMKTPIGQAQNAEQVMAARMLMADVARTTEETLREATLPEAGPAAVAKGMRAVAVYGATMEAFYGIRAESGRGLRAWGYAVSGEREHYQRIKTMLEEAGGLDNARLFLKALDDVARKGKLPGGRYVLPPAQGFWNRVGRGLSGLPGAAQETYQMGLLWAKKTHVINTATAYLNQTDLMLQDTVASRLGLALGREPGNRVEVGEAMARAYGMRMGTEELAKIVAARVREGDLRGIGRGVGELRESMGISSSAKLDDSINRITSEKLGVQDLGALSMGVDYFGRLTRFPGTALGFEDDIGKIVSYRAEMAAQAFRTAASEGGDEAHRAARVAELLADPPESMKLEGLRGARYATFNDPLPHGMGYDIEHLGRGIQSLRGAFPPSFILFPYVRTPTNILAWGMERSPLAPLVGRWRADFAAGGARGDLATAKLAVGTLMAGYFMDLAFQGGIVGTERDPGRRALLMNAGIQADSFVTPGMQRTFRFNRLDGIGLLASTSANFADLVRTMDTEGEEPELEKIAAAIALSTAGTTQSKTWLFGMANAVDALEKAGSSDDIESMGAIRDYVNRTLRGFVPFSSQLEEIRHFTDPSIPQVSQWYEVPQALIAGLQDRLPRLKDFWGRTVRNESGLGKVYDTIIPIDSWQMKPEPIEIEMLNQGMSIQKIGKKLAWPGTRLGQSVPVDFRNFPHVYEAYQELAGNRLPIFPMPDGSKVGLLDYLNAIVTNRAGSTSDTYHRSSDGPVGEKRELVANLVAAARGAAREYLNDPQRVGDLLGVGFDAAPYLTDEFAAFRRYVAEREPLRFEQKHGAAALQRLNP